MLDFFTMSTLKVLFSNAPTGMLMTGSGHTINFCDTVVALACTQHTLIIENQR